MKNIKILKILAICLSLVLSLANIGFSAFAESKVDDCSYAELIYIENMLPKFLSSHDIKSDEIYISNSYTVYNADLNEKANSDTFIVFEKDSVIGLMAVEKLDDKYYSTFELNKLDTIQKLYEDNVEIGFISYDEKLYVETEMRVFDVSKNDINIEIEPINIELNHINKIANIRNNISNSNSVDYFYRKNISVPIVANEVCSEGHGLCWAAVIASKSDYVNGTVLTAMDVFNDLDNCYSGHPVGSYTWTMRGHNYYNMNCTYVNGMFNCADVYNNIRVNNPFYISISRSGGAHAVLMCGITLFNDDTGIYRVADSNRTVYVDIAVSEDIMVCEAPFIYATTYGYTYTSWNETYY